MTTPPLSINTNQISMTQTEKIFLDGHPEIIDAYLTAAQTGGAARAVFRNQTNQRFLDAPAHKKLHGDLIRAADAAVAAAVPKPSTSLCGHATSVAFQGKEGSKNS